MSLFSGSCFIELLFSRSTINCAQMLWSLQSPDLNPVKQPRGKFDGLTALSNTIIKAPNEGMSSGRRMLIPAAEPQSHEESMPRCTEAVLAAQSGPTP